MPPHPSPALLDAVRARRAETVHVPGRLARAFDRWVERGGQIALTGPPGSGRSHLLEHVGRTLSSRGRAWVRLHALSSDPWFAAELALRDPALPGRAAELPDHDDPARRAQAAAATLARRAPAGLWVLADDHGDLGAGTAAMLAALARRDDAHVLTAGDTAPRWADPALALPAWQAADAEAVLRQLLDRPVPPMQAEALLDAAKGRPGALIDLLDAALLEERLDPDTGLLRGGPGTASLLRPRPPERPTDPASATVGAVLALLRQPASPAGLARLSGVPEAAVHPILATLARERLVRVEQGRAACIDRAAVAVLTPAPSRVRALHRTLALALAVTHAPDAWLLHHVVGSEDADLTRRYGPRALRATAARDPDGAAAVATRLVELGGGADLAAAAVPILGAGDRATAAVALGEAVLRALPPDADPVARARLGAELARLHAERLRDPTAARDLLRGARRALAGQPPPLTLLYVEASLHLQQGNPEQALSAARAGLPGSAPSHPADRSAWLGLRTIEARALVATDRIRAALDRLRDLPVESTPTERERLTVEAAVLAWKAGQFEPAARAFAAAARIDPDTAGVDQVRWMDRAATARYHAGDRGAAADTWERALRLARAARSPSERARVEATLCSVLREACRFEESARYGQQAYDRGLHCGAFQHATNAALAMADLRMVTGASDDAAAWLGRAGRLVERQRLQRARGRLARRWAELAVRRKDPRAMDTVIEALRSAQRSELVRDVARVTALKAVLLAREGRSEQLTATLKRAMEPLITQGASRTLAEVRLWAAQALLESGQPQQAIDEAAHAVVWADEVGHQLFRNRGDDLTARARAHQRKGAPEAGASDLERLLEVGVALGRERDLSAVLDQIARAAMHLVEADRAFVVLAEDQGGHRVAAAHSRDGASPGRPSSSVVQTALSRGREVIVSNVEERGDLRAQDSIVHLRLRSAWCLPLIEGDRTLGVIYADSQIVTQGELSRATRLLRALAGPAAVAVTNARLLAESASRAERAADIAHDIRSPLASVAMAAEQLRTVPQLPDWTLETLGLMESQVRRVMDMAHRFLEDSPSQPRSFDLAQRAERLASIAARDARHRGRTVTFEAGGRAVIHAAPDDLDRAITNLLSNALQHTPEGTTVEVRVDVGGREARLTVRDHGPGVPADLLPHLFERGVRNSETGGFGLGLSIARRIVGDAGGALSADNHPQGGARFQARFPLHATRVALDTPT